MKRAIYINRNHPILKYGRTGMFNSKTLRFYPDGGSFYKNTKGKVVEVLYFLTEKNHVWLDEEGYAHL